MVMAIDTSHIQPIASVIVRPVVISEEGIPVLRTEITVTIIVDDENDERQVEVSKTYRQQQQQQQQHDKVTDAENVRFTSPAQAERWVALTRSRVINPAAVIDIGRNIGRYLGGAEYLIITDNQRWNSQTVQPAGALAGSGDMVAEFERLAAWKRAKGLSARVVTITDIVNGRYGSGFAGSCRRDLQEVLREFIKWAYDQWGTAWLLLGGDIDIVPVRTVVGFVGGFASGATDPPENGGAYWTGTYLKVRANVAADTPLLRASDGHRIPYDSSGTSSTTQAGWYFTTDSTYSVRSTMPTGFVRVNGPAAQVNTELFWLTDDNTIPTDLYYADVAGYPERSANGTFVEIKDHFFNASTTMAAAAITTADTAASVSQLGKRGEGAITAPMRLCGGHDWDQVGNRLYGQWNGSADLDGVGYKADVSVGRAPVGNSAEAKTFVDKVLAYEQQSGWLFSSAAWLRKLLLVSSNWGGRDGYWPADPLSDDHYIKRANDNHAVIQLKAAPSSNKKLLCHISDSDERELPFRLDASPSQGGWCYAMSATDPTPSMIVIPFPWGTTFTIPIPSRWIVVYGDAAEMSPAYFVLDEASADGSMLDQETLRTQLAADVPGWPDVARLYEDDVDLGPAAVAAAPLEHLSQARLETHLDSGPHIVSLSGHGYWGGCCGLAPSMRTSLTNGAHTFIGYADSCLTNQFDFSDAISESLVQNDHGGAVAYVGNTRFSWIGVGDDFQRNFFKGLPATRALGILNDRRMAMLSASTGYWPVYNRWSIFSLNLIGDPEMRLWTHRPWRLCLELPERVRIDRLLQVQVLHNDAPVSGAMVTIEQQQPQAGFRRHKRTDRNGIATFDLGGASLGNLKVNAFHPNASMTSTTIQVAGPLWYDVKVRSVHIQNNNLPEDGNDNDDVAIIVLNNSDGNRTAMVPSSKANLLAALGLAAGSDKIIHVLLNDDNTIEAVEL
jgi:hypothetical protein